jgi:hypothetical protein
MIVVAGEVRHEGLDLPLVERSKLVEPAPSGQHNLVRQPSPRSKDNIAHVVTSDDLQLP